MVLSYCFLALMSYDYLAAKRGLDCFNCFYCFLFYVYYCCADLI